jgi:hypothetical protein
MQLGSYLCALSWLYGNIAEIIPMGQPTDSSKESVDIIINEFINSGLGYFDIHYVFLEDEYFCSRFRDRLSIVDIRRENPLLVVFEGIPFVMAAAVIISGGEYELGPLRVKLPPLGKGIKEIISAFRK